MYWNVRWPQNCHHLWVFNSYHILTSQSLKLYRMVFQVWCVKFMDGSLHSVHLGQDCRNHVVTVLFLSRVELRCNLLRMQMCKYECIRLSMMIMCSHACFHAWLNWVGYCIIIMHPDYVDSNENQHHVGDITNASLVSSICNNEHFYSAATWYVVH